MTFREKPINKLYAFALAALFALTLAGCGGGGGGSSTATTDDTMVTQQSCEADGGRWNDDMSCTSAADLATEKLAMERDNIKMKITAAQTAVGAVDNDSDSAEVSAADAAIMAAKAAIAAAESVPADEKAANTLTVTGLESQLATAKANRMTAMDAAKRAEDVAKAVMAAKLYAGVVARNTTTGADERNAAYSGDGDSQITVTIGEGTGNAVVLSEDKTATVPANDGWAGKRFADPAGGPSYEAMVYSNVGAPKPGKKFGQVGVTTAATGYEYGLNAAGELTTLVAVNVASPSFDHGSGTKKFPLPDTNTIRVMISGTYHGVAGMYYCTPGAGNTCAVEVAANNAFNLGLTANADNTFTAGSGSWAFKPSNPADRVMSSRDSVYSSYGWWIRTATDGKVTVSAFHDHKGDVSTAETANLPAAGTATYMGGAAGKYALSSATGGINDSGHFTARATLEAEFSGTDDHTISGTIDQFIGADGKSRDWSVKLNKAGATDAGVILGSGNGLAIADDNPHVGTVWTIGDNAAAKSGHWEGNLREQGEDHVPQVATGAFYSEYGPAGKMVGAFGANKK